MRGVKIAVLVTALWGVAYGQWEADKRLTVYPGYVDYGSYNNAWTIAVKDTLVHIVWEHRDSFPAELYYIRSINSGTTFETDKQLTTQDSHLPSIALSNSIVHVVWIDTRDGNLEIYYKRSIDNGVNWEPDVRLTYDPNTSQFPSISVSGSIVHTVWFDDRDGNWEIYYKRSIDNGVNWEPDVRLTNDPNWSDSPSIAVNGSIVHTVWYDFRDGNQEIYYKRSIDNGVNWEPDVRLTNDPSQSWSPSIAVWDSVVHLVWRDDRDGNLEIYYNHSVDNGMNWYSDERLTNAAGGGYLASVACWDCSYGYDVHIAWTDERDGNQEIYYKRHHCEPGGIEESQIDNSLEFRVNSISGIGGVNFSISLSHSSVVELKVFDIMGRLIDTQSLTFSAGDNNFDWQNNKSGVYFFSFKIEGKEVLKKGIIF